MLGQAQRPAGNLPAGGQPEREALDQQTHASHIHDKCTNGRYPRHHCSDGFAGPLLHEGMPDVEIRVHALRTRKFDATRREIAADAICLHATSLCAIAGCALPAPLTK
jgi:hypothetical protein